MDQPNRMKNEGVEYSLYRTPLSDMANTIMSAIRFLSSERIPSPVLQNQMQKQEDFGKPSAGFTFLNNSDLFCKEESKKGYQQHATVDSMPHRYCISSSYQISEENIHKQLMMANETKKFEKVGHCKMDTANETPPSNAKLIVPGARLGRMTPLHRKRSLANEKNAPGISHRDITFAKICSTGFADSDISYIGCKHEKCVHPPNHASTEAAVKFCCGAFECGAKQQRMKIQKREKLENVESNLVNLKAANNFTLQKECISTVKGKDCYEKVLSPETGLGTLICDAATLRPKERTDLLQEVGQAATVIITMVYHDGSSQLTARKDPDSSVSGFLISLKSSSTAFCLKSQIQEDNTLNCDAQDKNSKCIYLKFGQTPAWLSQGDDYSEFSRETLLRILKCHGYVICFNSKDMLRTVFHHYGNYISWKQVISCEVLDPRIAAWLLDPADTVPSFKDLVVKHCGESAVKGPDNLKPESSRHMKMQNLCSSLDVLYHLMIKLRIQLQRQGLWQLFCTMELRLITVLAVMETHKIHVDKAGLKRTSLLLETRLMQLEKDAHQAAGQQFRLTSSCDLRQVCSILTSKIRGKVAAFRK
ncbi:DNA polymerase nu-like [Protopterus annectens]|uniref:DNA polymerase nu-like n=1 Tax=Protopterus annectens TaxID=7888 RepID=UPI001CFB4F6B|nr:DNA polymerase nu-like [Protopterus annectens]